MAEIPGAPYAINEDHNLQNVEVLRTPTHDNAHLVGTVGTTADRLKSFVSRIERLEEDKKGLADDIKGVYGEAKGEGFDVKVLRKVIAIRKRDAEEVAEEEELLELYLSAVGGHQEKLL